MGAMYGIDLGLDLSMGDCTFEEIGKRNDPYYKRQGVQKRTTAITSCDTNTSSPHMGKFMAGILGWACLSYGAGLLCGNVIYMFPISIIGIFGYTFYKIIAHECTTNE
jgi:hypothetical protein